MPAEENRAVGNLCLLCIEHCMISSHAPDRFPAVMLREWKAVQIVEDDDLQRNWPISDDEATEILVASESFDALHAPSTVELAPAGGGASARLRGPRGVVRSWARAWQQLREQTRRSFTAWDQDGNPVYAEPSEMQLRPIREGFRSAVVAALDEVTPAAEAARIELAAVRATRAEAAPWCDALDRAITQAIDTASTWRVLTKRTPHSTPHWLISSDPSATWFAHRVANRWSMPKPLTSRQRARGRGPTLQNTGTFWIKPGRLAQSSYRPYDPEFGASVLQRPPAKRQRCHSPSHPLSPDLDTTARLAVAVAGNASEDEQLDLVERDRQRLPICAAAALLAAAARRGDGQTAPANAAREQLPSLWSETDWATATSWVGNALNGCG